MFFGCPQTKNFSLLKPVFYPKNYIVLQSLEQHIFLSVVSGLGNPLNFFQSSLHQEHVRECLFRRMMKAVLSGCDARRGEPAFVDAKIL